MNQLAADDKIENIHIRRNKQKTSVKKGNLHALSPDQSTKVDHCQAQFSIQNGTRSARLSLSLDPKHL